MVATTEDKKKYKLTHKQVDKTVDSPCIQICTYDEEEEFCFSIRKRKFIYNNAFVLLKLILNYL